MNLLEILVTITIIGLLMAAVATNVLGAKDRADHDIARMDVVQLRQAVEGWRLPETLAELVPAEVRRVRMDPWGHAVRVHAPGRRLRDLLARPRPRDQRPRHP